MPAGRETSKATHSDQDLPWKTEYKTDIIILSFFDCNKKKSIIDVKSD